MQVIADRSDSEAALTLGGTWLAFVAAVALALPQPPNIVYITIGAAVGAVLVVVGFAAASRVRPLVRQSPRQRVVKVSIAATSGVTLGAILLAILIASAHLEPALQARFAGRQAEPLWRPWALGFESAVLEETTFRLFAMSVIAWLTVRITHNQRIAFFVALFTSALLFGLAHVPAWAAAGHLSWALVTAVLLLNGAGGLLLGWIFWRLGMPYAIICHMLGDVVIQSFGPRLIG